MATAPAIPSAPLVANILFIAHGGGRQNGIALEFLDLDGNSLASGLTDPDALEALGRQAMAVALAARACDPNVVPIGQRPRAKATLIGTASTSVTIARHGDTGGQGQEADEARALNARAFDYMLVGTAALALALTLVAWAIWA